MFWQLRGVSIVLMNNNLSKLFLKILLVLQNLMGNLEGLILKILLKGMNIYEMGLKIP